MIRLPLPLLAACLLVPGCASTTHTEHSDAESGDSAVVDWLADSAIRLEAVEAGNGFHDLQALREVIGDARVVMLGEPTHGNREVFQLKHRLIEFLVEQMGFTTIALETPMAESFDGHDYVATGLGTPEGSLAATHVWPFDTEEVAELLAWMRAHNARPDKPREIGFYGFDMQSSERACRVTLEYLDRVDASLAEKARTTFGHLAIPYSDAEAWGYRPMVSRDSDAGVQQGVASVLAQMEAQRETWSAVTGAADWVFARHHVRLLWQWVETNRDDGAHYNEVRDRSMAENLHWILEREGPGAKLVVWAHNIHLANLGEPYPGEDFDMVGRHMRKALGEELVIVGILCGRGGMTAIEEAVPSQGVTNFELGPTPAGSIETLFAEAGLDLALVDLRRLTPGSAVAEWFSEKRPTRSNFGGYDPGTPGGHTYGYTYPYLLPEAFDALAFVDRTTPTRIIDPSNYGRVPTLPAPTNPSFEGGLEDGIPEGWQVWSKLTRFNFEIGTTTELSHHGDVAAVIRREPANEIGEASGNIAQFVDATPYRGDRVVLRAAARAEPADGDISFLRLRVLVDPTADAHEDPPALFDSLDTCRVESANWQVYEIEADIPKNASTLSFGLYLTGSGAAWLDDVRLERIDE